MTDMQPKPSLSKQDDLRTSLGEVVRRVDLDRAAGTPGRFLRADPSVAGHRGVDLAEAALAGDLGALDEFHERAGLALPGIAEYAEGEVVRLTTETISSVLGGTSCEVPPHHGETRAVFVARNECGHNSTRVDAADLVAWTFSPEGRAALARRGVIVPAQPARATDLPSAGTTDPSAAPATQDGIPIERQIDLEALRGMRAARDAEAATADRTAQLYDEVLIWALSVEIEAVRVGVPLPDYLARGSLADHGLWLAVARHRERYPASAGSAAIRDHVASAQSPSLRPWAPAGEVELCLGSAAGVLARLADLTDGQVADGLLAGPPGSSGASVARVEALAYRDAVRAGLAALRGDGRVYRQTYRILEDLAVARRVHDPELGRAVDVLLDQLAYRLVADPA